MVQCQYLLLHPLPPPEYMQHHGFQQSPALERLKTPTDKDIQLANRQRQIEESKARQSPSLSPAVAVQAGSRSSSSLVTSAVTSSGGASSSSGAKEGGNSNNERASNESLSASSSEADLQQGGNLPKPIMCHFDPGNIKRSWTAAGNSQSTGSSSAGRPQIRPPQVPPLALHNLHNHLPQGIVQSSPIVPGGHHSVRELQHSIRESVDLDDGDWQTLEGVLTGRVRSRVRTMSECHTCRPSTRKGEEQGVTGSKGVVTQRPGVNGRQYIRGVSSASCTSSAGETQDIWIRGCSTARPDVGRGSSGMRVTSSSRGSASSSSSDSTSHSRGNAGTQAAVSHNWLATAAAVRNTAGSAHKSQAACWEPPPQEPPGTSYNRTCQSPDVLSTQQHARTNMLSPKTPATPKSALSTRGSISPYMQRAELNTPHCDSRGGLGFSHVADTAAGVFVDISTVPVVDWHTGHEATTSTNMPLGDDGSMFVQRMQAGRLASEGHSSKGSPQEHMAAGWTGAATAEDYRILYSLKGGGSSNNGL